MPTFKFAIDANNEFVFTPKEEWAYKTGDKVSFASENGPFVIEMLPIHPTSSLIEPKTASQISPFVEFRDGEKIRITSVQAPGNSGEWRSHTELTPRDPRDVPLFAHLFAANNNKFLARYRYIIMATKNGEKHLNTDHNGQWGHPC